MSNMHQEKLPHVDLCFANFRLSSEPNIILLDNDGHYPTAARQPPNIILLDNDGHYPTAARQQPDSSQTAAGQQPENCLECANDK